MTEYWRPVTTQDEPNYANQCRPITNVVTFPQPQYAMWHIIKPRFILFIYYLRRRLADGESIVTLCLCVRRAATVVRIHLGGEGNVLYPVLSSLNLFNGTWYTTYNTEWK